VSDSEHFVMVYMTTQTGEANVVY